MGQSKHHSQAWGQCRKGLPNGVVRQKRVVTYYPSEVIYSPTAWSLQNYVMGNTFLGSTISKLKKKILPLSSSIPSTHQVPLRRSNHSWVSLYLSSTFYAYRSKYLCGNLFTCINMLKRWTAYLFYTIAYGTQFPHLLLFYIWKHLVPLDKRTD